MDYEVMPSNVLPNGLTLLQTNPDCAADEIERLNAALRHVVRLYMVDDLAYNPDLEVERIVQRLLSNA